MDINIFNTNEFEEKYFFGGQLGAIYTKNETVFNVWSPIATKVKVVFFEDGHIGAITKEVDMTKIENGVFTYKEKGNLNGRFYNYKITIDGIENEVTDLYAKAVGVNGIRSMVIDLEETNPTGWKDYKRPLVQSPTDVIIYELHIRDLSTDENAGIKNVGKFLGLTEAGTTSKEGLATGLDHIKQLGVTHVHLLPIFDYCSIDETKLHENNFNWGYDPQNFNVPEGSYSTDPYCGYNRIKELKQMIKILHDNGISVIMDVVYNHTYKTNDSNFTMTVPYYYYRTDMQGNYTNGSATGNETASERIMVNKYIVDSVKYWAKEYQIDGFRFDLMGLHDVKLMNDIRESLDEIDKSIIVYGEGWEAGGSPLDKNIAALKMNASLVSNRIAFFNDDIRDATKGHVFDSYVTGFVNAKSQDDQGIIETLKFGIVGSISHPQTTLKSWASEPTQSIIYMSAHDNLTLWDKLKISTKESEYKLLKMNKLSAVILFTSQGVPFFHAGEELARSKNGDENSYKSPDNVNQIKWSNKEKYINLFDYYKGLISLRKKYELFRMSESDQVVNNLKFLESEQGTICYLLKDQIAVLLNGNDTSVDINIPSGNWVVVVNENKAGVESLHFFEGDVINVPAKTGYVLIDKERFEN